ncbi:MAG: SPFH domain-containing protein [Clostridiales bacterium]|jgi:membrane protease subunit (stomatin/prohibitin family)|nr:SPFH domain-containing protein [Clostridiales bacterium]
MAIIDRVKFDGLASRDWLVYKHPSENLVFGTQLIVNEGQVAVFIKGGRICDVFLPGTHTLNAGNLPILNSIINLPFGSKTPFTAEIYYINTVTKLDINWGTSDPIQVIDPKYQIRLRVRAFGQLGLKIENYTLFISELIGSMNQADVVKYDKILNYYKGVLISKIKTIIADMIINDKISVLEISAMLDDISRKTQELLDADFDRYGFKITNFFIKSINFPDEDFEKINQILEDRAAFEIMGDGRYVTKRSFDVYEGAATNESGVAGAFAAGGIGLGTGAALAGGVNNVLNINPQAEEQCNTCRKYVRAGSKFCSHCGSKLAQLLCPKCSSPYDEGSKFCSECGHSLTPEACECGVELPSNAKFCMNCGKKVNNE